MSSLIARLAGAAATHSRRALALVALVVVALIAAAQLAGGTFSDDFGIPGTESQAARDLLEERFPAKAGDTATLVFWVEDGRAGDDQPRGAIERTLAAVEAQPHVTGVSDPFARGGQVSEDGRVAAATVQYDEPALELGAEPAERLADASGLAERDGVAVARNGPVVEEGEGDAPPVGEIAGVAVAMIVLTIVFRSAAAMAVTLISAGIAILAGVMLLTLGASATRFPTVAPTLAIMLGLGAGIDYALLIVGRYRERLAMGDGIPEAAAAANRTAGTSVLAAGAIVVVAIAGLLAAGVPMLGKMGIGSALVVATVAVGAITVLPTLLGAAGGRLRPSQSTIEQLTRATPSRWDRLVTAHPWRATIAGVLVVALLAVPALTLRLGQPDDGNDAAGSTTRKAYDTLTAGFGPGYNGPLLLAAELDPQTDSASALEHVHDEVAATPGVAAVSPPTLNARGDAAVMTVIPTTAPQDEATSALVDRLRSEVLPAASGVDVLVGGTTATFEDLADTLAGRLPVFIALVVGLAVLLLMAVFRSIWVPVISAVFNVFSIVAAYGVVVAVFQWNWGGSLLGMAGSVPIVPFIPLFMFAVLFGLSMDYNVFLQSRVREEYLAGRSARDSVLIGFARTTRIILGAGLIMTAVFLGFVTTPDPMIKTVGLGMAVAILIDVFVVRLVIAPAVMSLLGDRAWWMPTWLDRLLPRIALEAAED